MHDWITQSVPSERDVIRWQVPYGTTEPVPPRLLVPGPDSIGLDESPVPHVTAETAIYHSWATYIGWVVMAPAGPVRLPVPRYAAGSIDAVSRADEFATCRKSSPPEIASLAIYRSYVSNSDCANLGIKEITTWWTMLPTRRRTVSSSRREVVR